MSGRHIYRNAYKTTPPVTCLHFTIPPPVLPTLPLHFHTSYSYLEGHPDGVYLGSRAGEGGRPGPDGEQRGLSSEQLKQGLADGALVLVTGHHEVKDNERGKAKEAQHGDQGKPVHLPGDASYTYGYNTE